jgi:hypothetical protein
MIHHLVFLILPKCKNVNSHSVQFVASQNIRNWNSRTYEIYKNNYINGPQAQSNTWKLMKHMFQVNKKKHVEFLIFWFFLFHTDPVL